MHGTIDKVAPAATTIEKVAPAATLAAPIVSVIIPTRNRQAMLKEAIASVHDQQSFRDYEIIIASNGEHNPNKTRDIADRYGCRLVVLHNGNRSAARNAAIKIARGEWIAFLDDDDLWHCNKLVLQLAFAKHSEADCVFTDFILHHVRNETKDSRYTIGPGPYEHLSVPESFMLWRTGSGGCSTVLVKRSALLAVGDFDVRMTLAEDWDMWRRLSQACQVGFLHEPLSILRTHSANGEDHALKRPLRCAYWDVYHFCKAIRNCPPELRHMIPRVIWRAAWRAFYLCPLHIMLGPGSWVRARLRPRRRINALFGRELFK